MSTKAKSMSAMRFGILHSARRLERFVALSFALAALAMGWHAIAPHLTLNLTPSEPRGIYWVSPLPAHVEPGTKVLACMPQGRAMAEALARHYTSIDEQSPCPGHVPPVLKTVYAAPGMYVYHSRQFVATAPRGIRWAMWDRSRTARHDELMRPLPHSKFGVIHLRRGQFWLMSRYSLRSFDSRYWGPDSHVLAEVKPIITL